MIAGIKIWLRLLRPRKRKGVGASGPGTIPALVSRTVRCRVEPLKLKKYRALCGESDGESQAVSDLLPAAYLQHLAGGLHLEVLADRAFPYSPLGLVHVKNEIFQARPILASETEWDLTACLSDGGLHIKGQLIRIETRAIRGGDHPNEKPAWRSVITALLPGKFPHSMVAGSESKVNPRDDSPDSDHLARKLGPFPPWALRADLGRRFSFLMGDFNPIHLWPWSARLFGFPRPIIHGMWTLGRALHALESELPPYPRAIEIQFKRPIPLPNRVSLSAQTQPARQEVQFSIFTQVGDKAAATGRVATSSMSSAESQE